MAIIRFRDENGEVKELTVLRGEKGDPGEGVLVVTEKNGVTSHSSAEIYEAYQQDKAVFLKTNNRLIPIGGAGTYASYFLYVQVDGVVARTAEYLVTGNRLAINYYLYHPPVDISLTQRSVPADSFTVGQKLGDVETALDNIIAIQNNLIGGGNE